MPQNLFNLNDNPNQLAPYFQQQCPTDHPTSGQSYDPINGDVVEQGVAHRGVHGVNARHPGEYVNNPANSRAKLNMDESLPSTSSQQLDGYSLSYWWDLLYTDPSRSTQHTFVDRAERFSQLQNLSVTSTVTQDEVMQAHHHARYQSYGEPIDDMRPHNNRYWSQIPIYG
jgi:hypothetical protein